MLNEFNSYNRKRQRKVNNICMKKRTEKSIMLEVSTRLSYAGWRCKRVPPSIYASKGWCDVIAIRKGMVLFIEFKGEKGKLSPEQKVFGRDIEDAGGNYIVCRKWEDILEAIT